MRSAILIAAGCVLCLSQPSFAYAISVQFSKPSGTYEEFLQDRNACLLAASRSNWRTASGGGGMIGPGASPGGVTYNFSRFGKCMLARGYQLDPNGFEAVKFRHLRNGNYALLKLKRSGSK